MKEKLTPHGKTGRNSRLSIPTALAATACLGLAVYGGYLRAADHQEAPGTKEDLNADLADVYAWHDEDKLVLGLTFNGLKDPVEGQVGTYDPNALYTIHIDNNADNYADFNIHVRFGQNAEGLWGVQVQNLPGSDEDIIGPVEEIIYVANGRYVYAGLREEPFFFDLEGFKTTVSTGTLSFSNTRDFFAGKNCTAIVVEADLAAALDGATSLQVWATTGRLPS